LPFLLGFFDNFGSQTGGLLLMADNESSVSNFFVGNGSNNPYTNGGGSSNPFEGGGSPLTTGDISNLFADGENPLTNGDIYNLFADGKNPLASGENPLASGDNLFAQNQNFGSNNATIGTGNWDLSSNNATIGNGNWNIDSASYNATVGNGNWLREDASSNTTVGNGNWYWDSASENSTLGNGNWSFGSDNSTIGNGNWDFGKNNTIIGNGNWVLTDNTVVIGNGNWFLSDDPTASEASQNIATLEAMFPELKSDIDSLIGSLVGGFGTELSVLAGDLDAGESQTFEQLILSKGNGSDISTFSDGDLAELFTSLSGVTGTDITTGNPTCVFGCPDVGIPSEPVPEPSSVLSLLALGLVYFVWSKKFKAKSKLSLKN
jgi:hypothetical protein